MMKQVTIPAAKQKLTLKTDKRIRYDAIRVLRTLQPRFGLMYADTRKGGVRYKVAYTGMTVPQKQKLVTTLNAIYKANNINAKAYIHEAQGGAPWMQSHAVCVMCKYK